MRRVHARHWLCALLVLCALGCQNNPYVMQGQIQTLQQSQLAMTQDRTQLQDRASALDRDNRELEAMLAQSQQQSRLLDDQLNALREQLRTTTAQLADVRQQYKETDERTRTMTASIRRRGGAQITANNSLKNALTFESISGVEVRQDGDVIRVELPGARLFTPGSARLLPEAGALLDQVAGQVRRAYPDQMIGIEGHTDSDPIQGGQWQNNHQLSIGRAMAVYDYFTARGGFQPQQLMVVGHGANHPVVSNATSSGRERNRRVELVIYPDQVAKAAAGQ